MEQGEAAYSEGRTGVAISSWALYSSLRKVVVEVCVGREDFLEEGFRGETWDGKVGLVH